MELFWKAISISFVTLVLNLTLEKANKDFGVLLTVSAVGMIAVICFSFFRPVFSLMNEIVEIGQIQNNAMQTLVKIIGIALTGEISSCVCSDGGSASLGKGIHILTNAVIVYLSMPFFSSILELLQQLIKDI